MIFQDTKVAEAAAATKDWIGGKVITWKFASTQNRHSCSISVGGLPCAAREQSVTHYFSKFGDVTTVDVKMTADGQFAETSAAELVLSNHHEHVLAASGEAQTHRHTNKRTSIETHKHTKTLDAQTNKRTNERTNKQTDIQTHKHTISQTHEHINTHANTHANKQTNKQTSK